MVYYVIGCNLIPFVPLPLIERCQREVSKAKKSKQSKEDKPWLDRSWIERLGKFC